MLTNFESLPHHTSYCPMRVYNYTYANFGSPSCKLFTCFADTCSLYSHPNSPALNMEAIYSSETSVLTKNTRRKIPEDGFLHSHRRETLKSYIFTRILISLLLQRRPQFTVNMYFPFLILSKVTINSDMQCLFCIFPLSFVTQLSIPMPTKLLTIKIRRFQYPFSLPECIRDQKCVLTPPTDIIDYEILKNLNWHGCLVTAICAITSIKTELTYVRIL
jgi:hypothetical protein